MKKTSNEMAFPREDYQEGDCRGQGGMTLRQWYAGQALAGLCSNPGGPFQESPLSGWTIVNCDQTQIAEECFRLADAMIKVGG